MRVKLSQVDPPKKPLRASIEEADIEDLARSIKQLGQLQPCGVEPIGGDRFRIIYGHRRYLALKWLDSKWIDVTMTNPVEGSALSARALVENNQRTQLTPVEDAYAIHALMEEEKCDEVRAAQLLGRNVRWVRGRLELLAFPEVLQAHVHAGTLSLAVATELAKLSSSDHLERYVGYAIDNNAPASTVAVWVQAQQMAETGLAPALSDEAAQAKMTGEPQIVDQHYHCFDCGELRNWREVNTLVLCGGCQQLLAATRAKRHKQET